jgi:hypothetical protein
LKQLYGKFRFVDDEQARPAVAPYKIMVAPGLGAPMRSMGRGGRKIRRR